MTDQENKNKTVIELVDKRLEFTRNWLSKAYQKHQENTKEYHMQRGRLEELYDIRAELAVYRTEDIPF